MHRLHVILVALLALTFLRAEDQGGCDSTIVGDPTFDMWCGSKLCAWDVEAGQVRRVSTWHRSDYGVELVGEKVVISQLSEIGSASCFELRLQADHDEGVNLFMELDFLDDGTIEHSQPMTTDDYRPSTFHLRPPGWFSGVRFKVRKAGKGRAVLAEIKVKTVGADKCAGAAAIQLSDLPAGAGCGSAAECASGRCDQVLQYGTTLTRVCSACASDADCTSGQVCGLEAGSALGVHLYQGCGAAGRHGLGERCRGDAECGSGICCLGVCSECCSTAGNSCAGGETCKRRPWQDLGTEYLAHQLPHQCAPGGGKGAAGALCLRDDDCAGGSCKGSGQLKTCIFDGRICTKDSDCTLWPDGGCLPIGQADGKCQ